MTETDAVMLHLTGAAPFLLIFAGLLTALLSAVLLRLYRAAVVRGQRQAEAQGGNDTGESLASPGDGLSPPHQLRLLRLDPTKTTGASTALSVTDRARQRLALSYALGGLAYAVVLSIPWQVNAGSGFVPMRALFLVTCYFWPAALALAWVFATTRLHRQALLGGYFAWWAVVTLIAVARSSSVAATELVFYWFFANGVQSLLVLAFLRRSVRAIGPLVLAFTLVAGAGAIGAVSVVGESQNLLWQFARFGNAVGLGAGGVFALINVLGVVVLAFPGVLILRRLASAHRNKRLSDQSLTLDALWLSFGVSQSLTLAFEGALWSLTGLVAFAAYKWVSAMTLRRLTVQGDAVETPRELLLLRVFALGRRSEGLLDAVQRRWLHWGNITLIAGPDLATMLVAPGQFLAFVTGKLSQYFVNTPRELDEHLRSLDRGRDPDGRYRVSQLFCRDRIWKRALERLVEPGPIVLMDLRSFSADNSGCLYELEQLLATVPLPRVLLLADSSTHSGFLEHTVQRLWRRLPQGSPNRHAVAPELAIFWAPDDSLDVAEALTRELMARSDGTKPGSLRPVAPAQRQPAYG